MNREIDVPWEHCGERYMTHIEIPLDRLSRLTGVPAPDEEWGEFLDWMDKSVLSRYVFTGVETHTFYCSKCGYTVDVGAELRCFHKIWRMTAKLLD
jgi:hypothetical protein